jgi:hypothetical protein
MIRVFQLSGTRLLHLPQGERNASRLEDVLHEVLYAKAARAGSLRLVRPAPVWSTRLRRCPPVFVLAVSRSQMLKYQLARARVGLSPKRLFVFTLDR